LNFFQILQTPLIFFMEAFGGFFLMWYKSSQIDTRKKHIFWNKKDKICFKNSLNAWHFRSQISRTCPFIWRKFILVNGRHSTYLFVSFGKWFDVNIGWKHEISGYWWLFYQWLLVAIGGYSINDY
jgi:hypothetical protein